jgi:hypothetical protein
MRGPHLVPVLLALDAKTGAYLSFALPEDRERRS